MHRTVAVILLVLSVGCTSPGPVGEVGDLVPRDLGEDPGLEPIEPVTPSEPSGQLAVHVLDVGQGDATVWQLPGGGLALYDCGGGRSSADTLPVTTFLEEELGLAPGAMIDLLVVSHGHLDHLRECEEVFEAYQVDDIVDVWYTGQDRTQAYEAFQGAAVAEGAQLWTVADVPDLTSDRRLAAGDTLPLPPAAQEAGVHAQVLWPPGPMVDRWDEIAETSLVVRLSHGPVDVCFQGDITTEEEAVLRDLTPGIDCEGYLVGHHGSADASSTPWLEHLEPEVAVVSFGENPYGHPTSQALCRVQSVGAPVYATHRLGEIELVSDGTGLTVVPDQPETQDHCQAGAGYWETAPTGPDEPAAGIDGTLTVEARPSDPAPCRHTDVTIQTQVTDGDGTPVANASVETTWRYKTSSPKETTTTDARGWGNTTRYISGAAAGYTVEVEVKAWTADHGGQTTTSFTPQGC